MSSTWRWSEREVVAIRVLREMVQRLKRIGPRTEPYGIPKEIAILLRAPPIDTVDERVER